MGFYIFQPKEVVLTEESIVSRNIGSALSRKSLTIMIILEEEECLND
jgi:hypothetical protein